MHIATAWFSYAQMTDADCYCLEAITSLNINSFNSLVWFVVQENADEVQTQHKAETPDKRWQSW